jgi:hypothetical protein
VQRNSDLAFKKNFYPGIFGIPYGGLQNRRRLPNNPGSCRRKSFYPNIRMAASFTNKNACIFAGPGADNKPKTGSLLNVKLTLLKTPGRFFTLFSAFR